MSQPIKICSVCMASGTVTFVDGLTLAPKERLEARMRDGVLTFFKGFPPDMVQLEVVFSLCESHAS